MPLLDIIATVSVIVVLSVVWIFIAPLLGLQPLVTQQIVNLVTPKIYHSIKSTKQDFITVYAFRVSSLARDLDRYQKSQYETTNGQLRPLRASDNYCCICKRFIGNMNRRILHETISECYVCYRKRVIQEDLQVFLLLSEISFQEVTVDLQKLIYWNFYQKLRVERLVVTPAPNLETSLKIPDFHYILMHFPELPMPEWVDDRLVWYYNFVDQSYYDGNTFDINLWLRILPKRRAKDAWERLRKELSSIAERTRLW